MPSGSAETRRVVLDTSLFVNPEVRGSLGATPTEAFSAFLSLARSAPGLEFYMPPSVFEELMNFVNREALSGELLLTITQRPPARLDIRIPGEFLYDFVEQMRERVNKGLRIAEKSLRGALSAEQDVLIKDLRRKYRDALREGILDSKEDVDLMLLAYELGALLVTADAGVIAWAERIGIAWLPPEKFREFIEAASGR
jgi:RNA ligase partner protein